MLPGRSDDFAETVIAKIHAGLPVSFLARGGPENGFAIARHGKLLRTPFRNGADTEVRSVAATQFCY
jgi:hypothetical protein